MMIYITHFIKSSISTQIRIYFRKVIFLPILQAAHLFRNHNTLKTVKKIFIKALAGALQMTDNINF